MRFQEIDYFEFIMTPLAMLRLLRDYGKDGNLLDRYRKIELCEDLLMELHFEALNQAAEFVTGYYLEEYECDKFIFSSEAMTEYYRLCREYGRRHKLPSKENPFVKKADIHVSERLHLNGYGYGWDLKIGTRHKYASCLYFYQYSDFNRQLELLESVLQIFEFYDKELAVLRAELSGGKELLAA